MDDVKCRHKDADKWRERHYKLCDAKSRNVDKVDIKKTTFVLINICVNKGQPIAALFDCVFLDTKKEKEWLIIYLYSLLW